MEFASVYIPQQNICVDELLHLWKQVVPSRCSHFGLKMCDSKSTLGFGISQFVLTVMYGNKHPKQQTSEWF
jgi:hypothetical protein